MDVALTEFLVARGKDGYESLLIKSEGGEAGEVVEEENGVLISTILRQYFMSLKVFTVFVFLTQTNFSGPWKVAKMWSKP